MRSIEVVFYIIIMISLVSIIGNVGIGSINKTSLQIKEHYTMSRNIKYTLQTPHQITPCICTIDPDGIQNSGDEFYLIYFDLIITFQTQPENTSTFYMSIINEDPNCPIYFYGLCGGNNWVEIDNQKTYFITQLYKIPSYQSQRIITVIPELYTLTTNCKLPKKLYIRFGFTNSKQTIIELNLS